MAKVEGYVIKVSYLHEAYISSFHICFYLIKKMLIAKEGKVKRISILLMDNVHSIYLIGWLLLLKHKRPVNPSVHVFYY